jgi:membrane protein DedA with SNARE-associated domain/rhodanese-related sulfurtransferase
MTETSQFLIRHGTPIIFGAVFLEQIGLPLPSPPWLLAAGALAAMDKFNPLAGIGVTLAACLLADAIWFYLGRFRGHQVLGWLCRISLEPDSCVRRTQNVFTRYGLRGIVVAKFVPGLSTVAPPLAGMSNMRAIKFLSVDAVGSLLYGSVFIYAGFFFSSQIQQIGAAIANIGGKALCLAGGLLAAYIAYKYWQRQRLLEELRTARITVADLRQLLDKGTNVAILDMRSSAEVESDPALIQGAIRLTMDEVKNGKLKIPTDREVVVYCSCPNEVTAARAALLLRGQGFTNVRPLLGGIDAWRAENLPVSKFSPPNKEANLSART